MFAAQPGERSLAVDEAPGAAMTPRLGRHPAPLALPCFRAADGQHRAAPPPRVLRQPALLAATRFQHQSASRTVGRSSPGLVRPPAIAAIPYTAGIRPSS